MILGGLARWLPGLIAALLLPLEAPAQTDAAARQWLQRIYSATQKLSYSGTFVYHYDDQVETSRITRIVDASGPIEKLEALDGVPREIIRRGDEVVCYLPASMTMKVDKLSGRKVFPAILPDQLNELSDYYVIRRGGVERVAGFPSQIVILTPKDGMRYGRKLWADVHTGMLLRAKTFNERNEVMESFTFTDLQIGGHIERERVRSQFAGKGKDWHVENSGAAEANLAQAGWTLRAQPPGFRKITEMTRTLGGKAGVGHMVLSDGLAAMSVFIQVASSASSPPGLSRQGAINVYSRDLGGHRITVVGEAPAESVKFIANAIERRTQ
ncbi:MAG: MucB/RseB C-terminal domain-containing protein [Betaproteobacteria bacterium]|nr:MucB/RseB C-terminal domain-containing protein [Betaproteobacteria bacterium]